MSMRRASEPTRAKRTFWYLLLLIPFVGGLWVPLYNRAEPFWWGIPFFYWFQFFWVVFTAVITALAYRAQI